jgi:hypothetical protein
VEIEGSDVEESENGKSTETWAEFEAAETENPGDCTARESVNRVVRMKDSENEGRRDPENDPERRNGDDPTYGSVERSEFDGSKSSDCGNKFESHVTEAMYERVAINRPEFEQDKVTSNISVSTKSALSVNKSDGVGGAAGQ